MCGFLILITKLTCLREQPASFHHTVKGTESTHWAGSDQLCTPPTGAAPLQSTVLGRTASRPQATNFRLTGFTSDRRSSKQHAWRVAKCARSERRVA